MGISMTFNEGIKILMIRIDHFYTISVKKYPPTPIPKKTPYKRRQIETVVRSSYVL